MLQSQTPQPAPQAPPDPAIHAKRAAMSAGQPSGTRRFRNPLRSLVVTAAMRIGRWAFGRLKTP